MTGQKEKLELSRGDPVSFVEVAAVLVVIARLIALAVPLCRWFAADMRWRENRANVNRVLTEAKIQIQAGIGGLDASDPPRRINEGLRTGWVALARMDGNKNIVSLELFVVDDIAAYVNGIAEGAVTAPIPAGSSDTFYPVPEKMNRSDPFSHVTPSSGLTNGLRNTVYTVQAVVASLEADLVPV